MSPENPPATLERVTRRTARAAAALLARQGLVYTANGLGAVLLARALTPGAFGILGVALFAQGLLSALGGSGLAASLVRQRELPQARDERTLFTLLLALCTGVAALGWLLAPALARTYGRPMTEVHLFRLVSLSLVAVPFQAIAAARLERALDFARLGLVEAAQATVLNAGLVVAAWSGGEAWKFGAAFVARAATGAALAHAASPWRPGLAWDRERLSAQLRFGVPYQGATLVSLAKDAVTPVLVGLTAGALAVGYVNWAQALAAFPVWALMPFQRLYLPAFAQLQSDPQALGRLVERVVRAANALVAPLACFTLALAEPVTRIVFGERWLPALPLFGLLWTANLWVATVTPLLGLLNALGRARTAFAFGLAWMVATWALCTPLVLAFGPIGYGLANVAVQLVNLPLLRIAGRLAPVRLLRPAALPWAWAGALGAILYGVARLHPPAGLAALAGYLLAAVLVYSVGLLGADPSLVGRAGRRLRH